VLAAVAFGAAFFALGLVSAAVAMAYSSLRSPAKAGVQS
jgi:hypothetical protein